MQTTIEASVIFTIDLPEDGIRQALAKNNQALAFYDLVRENSKIFSTIESIEENFGLAVVGVYNGFEIQSDGTTVKYASDNFDDVIWEG